MKKLAVLLCLVVVAGCAGLDNTMLGYGRFSESIEKFDGSTRLEVTPARLPGAEVLLGARWGSSAPEWITLVVAYEHGQYGGYTSVRSVSLNINGAQSEYSADSISNIDRDLNIFTGKTASKSVNSIVVPLDVFEKMMKQEDVRLRFDTSDGYEDVVFSEQNNMNGARLALQKLLDRLLEIKS